MRNNHLKSNKTHELPKRLLNTLGVLAVYMLGRSLLLYRVDVADQSEVLNSQNILISMISGDRYRYTVFALGIMPYISATLIMMVFMALMGSDYRQRHSPRKRERGTVLLMLLIATAFAISRAGGLRFKPSSLPTQALRLIAILEMVAGAYLIHKMTQWNGKRGIGAQTPIILCNILDNLLSTLLRFPLRDLYRPLILCLVMAGVMLVMENVLIRIPVQRVSIHNDYADKSYIAFKLDPIGVMPVMFAVSFFMLPQLCLRLLLFFFAGNASLRAAAAALDLTNPIGVAVYLGIIFALNILFSFLMLSPGEMADNLQKEGDSIVGVYAGRKTRRYLRVKLLLLCLLSGTVFCLMMGTSLFFSLRREIVSELALFPTTAMILVGILCPLYREIKSYWKFDSYSLFISM